MAPDVAQWKCRVCGFDRWYNVTVRRKSGAIYQTSFYACAGCSAMFMNPAQFNEFGNAAPNVQMPRVVSIKARKA